MSPEQAKGKSVDKTTDIWAFGCVLYEMLTGQAAFQGEDVTEILASVVKASVNLGALPANIHPRIREILTRCLQKEQKRRYSRIADVQYEIEQVLADPGGVYVQPVTAAKPRKKLRLGLPWIAAAIALTAIIVGLVVWYMKPAEPLQVSRFDYALPQDQSFTRFSDHFVTVSADGSKIVYVANEQLYLKNSNELTARPIQGTNENPMYPFFSPNGEWIGYFSVDGQLKKIAVMGGASVLLCEGINAPGGATWGADDMIVFGALDSVMRVSANGGSPEEIVKGGAYFRFPQVLPDGKSVLFATSAEAEFQVLIQSLESEERKKLIESDYARYLTTGHLIYALENDLYAIPFDLDTLEVSGGPVPMVEGLFRLRPNRPSQFAPSDSGTPFGNPASS